jgi:alanine racemase
VAAPASTLSPNFPRLAFSRPTWAEINLAALRHNARVLHGAHGQSTPLITVIKADAYGHGALEAARALQTLPFVKMLAVASVDEARVLREHEISAPILLLSALMPVEAEAALALDLTATLSTLEVAAALNRAAKAQNKTARAHWKIDTGMGRLGTPCEEAAAFFAALCEYSHLKIEGVYTHFACADDARDEMTPCQIARFEKVLGECGISRREYFVHAANSAGALRYPAAHYDAIRPGIALYGANPLGVLGEKFDLQPVMSLRARITEIRKVKKGHSVSYGATWTAPRDSQLALVPLGYADGYSRALSNCGEVLLCGRKCAVVGRVTMDQILIDVTEFSSNVQTGEIVTAWGIDENGAVLRVETVAEKAGTISYELLCGVASRVPRVYLNETDK